MSSPFGEPFKRSSVSVARSLFRPLDLARVVERILGDGVREQFAQRVLAGLPVALVADDDQVVGRKLP